MFCQKCGAEVNSGMTFCGSCGTALRNADAPVQNSTSTQNTILYQGVCLQRLSGMKTVPGDAVITPQGLFYYKRSTLSKQINKKPCDFFVDSRNVLNIQTSNKNMNQVMELTMNDGSKFEFYSPQFAQMFAAMNESIRQSRV